MGKTRSNTLGREGVEIEVSLGHLKMGSPGSWGEGKRAESCAGDRTRKKPGDWGWGPKCQEVEEGEPGCECVCVCACEEVRRVCTHMCVSTLEDTHARAYVCACTCELTLGQRD